MKIVTDSAADIPGEELQELGIVQAPLFIQFPEGEVSSAEISADAFYDRLEAMQPAIPTTAQPSGGLFAELYRRIASADRDILSIHISSGLSGTIHAAEDGAAQARSQADVKFWDSLTLSGGQRFQVLAAALAARAGWTMQAIQQRMAQIRESTETVYTLETLDYLARGGRIGRVKALAGALLHLKPVIRVEHSDGKYSTVTSARTLPRAITSIGEHLQALYGNRPVWVTVLHGRFAERAGELGATLRDRLNVARGEVLRISPVLGVHTGPGIVGAAVVPLDLMSDLL
ncbi:MAG: DegV family protein [Bacteroidota bacterium]